MSLKIHVLLLTAAAGAASGLAVGAPPSTSAYFTDTQNSYVQDATSESIGQVNMIACIMSSMRPDALVNQGPYIALVDQNKCDASKRSSTSSSGSAGASQAANYMTVTVDSTRASNSDPMIVKAWVNDEQNSQPTTIFVHISATEAPSTANPYGAFRLDFCGKPGGGGACMMNGFMQGGAGALSYYQTESRGDGGGQTTALQLSSVGTSTGSGGLHMVQGDGNGGPQTSAFNFAYDQNYFLRDDGPPNGAQCFSRNAADPATGLSVWRYGLYDSMTGARVDLSSGFPIEYSSGGTTYQGFLGYWGLSLPSAATATLVTGSTVQKVDYSSSGGAPTRTSYTILQNGGKLTRYTKKTRTLHDLDQIQFNASVGDVGSSGLPTSNTQYEMYWDDASSKFVATSVMQCSQNGCQPGPLPNNTNISVDPSFWSSAGGIQGWSQSLGGELFIDLHGLSGAIVSTAITVAYRVQDLVYPGDTSVTTLYCVNNCPTAASLSGYFTQTGTPVASPYGSTYNNWNPVPASGVASYTVDANATLNDSSSAAVTFANATAYQQYPQYQNGVQSGRLFTRLADADCSAGGITQYCDYVVNGAPVYYVWETGPNSWNQFTAVKDSSNNFVHFDTPLQVNYSVPNDPVAYGAYANKSLVLQYGGFGNLWGIPGSCVSQLTNVTEDCSIQGARYVPQFVIPYDPTATPQQGVVTMTSNSVTTTYLVKWLEREIRFATKAPSVCTADQLTAPTNITLPTATQLKDPSDSSSDIYLGTKPTVTSAPRVIQGEVKY
jgi:hypothetical protein